jgi:hypothetical protein
MVLNKVHGIQIDREATVSNFEVMGELVDVDNHDEDVESAFGDRDVTVADGGKFSLVDLCCRVLHRTEMTVLEVLDHVLIMNSGDCGRSYRTFLKNTQCQAACRTVDKSEGIWFLLVQQPAVQLLAMVEYGSLVE